MNFLNQSVFRRVDRLILLTAFVLLAAACGGEFIDEELAFEDEILSPEDCFDDEYYDPVDQTCYLIEEDDEEGYEDDEGDGFDGGMTAEDCYDDEVYDAEDRMCYLDEENQQTIGEWLVGVAGDWLDNDIQFSDGEGLDRLISYDITSNDELTNPTVGMEAGTDIEADYQEDTAIHEQLWNQFAELIPAENREALTVYGVFTDGPDDTLAYVEPNEDDPTTWALILDPADTVNQQDFTYTLIHEYGHILTLNESQVPFDEEAYFDESGDAYDEAQAACSEFFTGEGCSRTTSYINLFFEQFWTDIYDELPFPDEEGIVDEDELYNFYVRYEDQFVTDYAATNPGEDIAESFTHFVLNQKPNGDTIAEQKILFFYDFPELIRLRNAILADLATGS